MIRIRGALSIPRKGPAGRPARLGQVIFRKRRDSLPEAVGVGLVDGLPHSSTSSCITKQPLNYLPAFARLPSDEQCALPIPNYIAGSLSMNFMNRIVRVASIASSS